MSDLLTFVSTTPRHALPNLFPGQAQKEFFVNEALARIDMLLHPVVEGALQTAPASPLAGQSFLVAAAAGGAWEGKDDCIAGWDGERWTFAQPSEGMRVFDRTLDGIRIYDDSWSQPATIPVPSGGSVVDREARDTIQLVIDCLRKAGLIA